MGLAGHLDVVLLSMRNTALNVVASDHLCGTNEESEYAPHFLQWDFRMTEHKSVRYE